MGLDTPNPRNKNPSLIHRSCPVQSRSTSSQCGTPRILGRCCSLTSPISCSHLVPSSNVTHSTKESRPNAKRPRHSDLSNQSSPVSKRFRTEAPKSSPDAKARRIVEGYDEELTCPLCVSVLRRTLSTNVAAQVLRLLVSRWSTPESPEHYSQCCKRCHASCEPLWSFNVWPMHR